MVAILRLFRPPDGKWLGSEVAFVGDKAGAGWRFHVKASLLTSLASDSWLVLVPGDKQSQPWLRLGEMPTTGEIRVALACTKGFTQNI